MTRLLRCSLLVCCAALLLCVLAPAQEPAPPHPTAPRGPRPAPTNLKVLPKDLTGDGVIKVMHQYEGDLGVECKFCHAQNPATHRNDFASDANPVKETARFMITMTEAINAKYVATLADRKSQEPVTCGTCHRGASVPPMFVPKPEAPRSVPPVK